MLQPFQLRSKHGEKSSFGLIRSLFLYPNPLFPFSFSVLSLSFLLVYLFQNTPLVFCSCFYLFRKIIFFLNWIFCPKEGFFRGNVFNGAPTFGQVCCLMAQKFFFYFITLFSFSSLYFLLLLKPFSFVSSLSKIVRFLFASFSNFKSQSAIPVFFFCTAHVISTLVFFRMCSQLFALISFFFSGVPFFT